MIDPEKQIKQSSDERKSLLQSEKQSRKEMKKKGKMKFQVGDL
jgi:hypothetical protein